jgi:hypothetical protein
MPRTRVVPEPPIYTFRVHIRGGFYAPEAASTIWREIEIAANQSLADLGEAIRRAFDFDDPHLWSFFLSGKAWDASSEYALRRAPGPSGRSRARAAGGVCIRDAPLPGKTGKQAFLFVFDYGDEWHFAVKFARTREQIEPGAQYPRVVAGQGDAPPQYPDVEAAFDDDSDDD